MTTILAQLGVPILICWEVKAGLDGYRVTHLAGKQISRDDHRCGPWAQCVDPIYWEMIQQSLTPEVQTLAMQVQTPYQLHTMLTRQVFPQAETTASWWLTYRAITEPALEAIARSPYAGSFSKLVRSDGTIIESRDAPDQIVRFDAQGAVVLKTDLAQSYLRLLEAVRQSETDPTFNLGRAGIGGVLPDARIMTVLDCVIYAILAQTDTVYAWSGVAMFQYVLKEPDSERWRDVTSLMYDYVRKVIPGLPETLTYVLIPTNGLGSLVIADVDLATKINQTVMRTECPRQYNKSVLRAEFTQALEGVETEEALAFLLTQAPAELHEVIRTKCRKGRVDAAIGIAAHEIWQWWHKGSEADRKQAETELAKLLVDDQGRFVLHHQPAIGVIEYLLGQRPYLLEGTLDIPTRNLESRRQELQRLAIRETSQKWRQEGGAPWEGNDFNRAGWL